MRPEKSYLASPAGYNPIGIALLNQDRKRKMK
jgi:hypothetical protein